MLRPLPTLKFEEGVVKKHMPFLKKYSSKQLHDIILETADCKLGMRYPVRYYDGDSYVNIDFGNYNCPSSFFSVVGVNNTKVSTDGKVLERSYQIRFDSYLGYIFVQNTVCSLYTDLLPDKFYNLTDSAQLLYRLLILPYYNNVKNPIRLEEIRQRLGWKTADISMVRNTIKRTLDELEAETFIRNPKEITTYGPYMYSYEKTPWKEIEK